LTLALLAQAWSSAVQVPAGPSPWLAAGLAGIGLFAIAWLSGELAARLLREERSALDNREHARRQALLNRLVIEAGKPSTVQLSTGLD
jgi:two-component system sensor histidine kinase PilS (NtrC family)